MGYIGKDWWKFKFFIICIGLYKIYNLLVGILVLDSNTEMTMICLRG